MKILICGLPGTGKTTLAEALAFRLQCVWFNGDDIRDNINKDLKFTQEDRIEQARRMGHLCGVAGKWGATVLADFVCPMPECHQVFNADYTIWVDRIKSGRFEDTNKLFTPPLVYDMRISPTFDHVFPAYHADEIVKRIHNYKANIPHTPETL
jgi:hypothetical protein